ncbi:multiple drug resistance-associated protein-like transporter 1 [[Candida] anglica]|uniref:Multiple drug resistance-associated protein-like transporter 1 n=1 Tax=[Candida] anglica TaxID=148631 RepID=A0ABP0ECE2_9ASCO
MVVSLGYEFPNPLASQHGSSINPEFFAIIVQIFSILAGLFALYQLLEILLSPQYGSFNIKYSFRKRYWIGGIRAVFRAGLTVLSGLCMAGLSIKNYSSTTSESNSFQFLAVTSIVSLFVIAPLQLLETTRSTIQLASVLLWFLGTSVWTIGAIVQDFASTDYKIVAKSHSTLSLTLEVLVVIYTILSYFLELKYWSPTQELIDYYALNEWDLDTDHNLFVLVSFSWVQKIIHQLYIDDDIDAVDLPPPISILSPEYTSKRLQVVWDQAVSNAISKRKSPNDPLNVSLFFCLVKAFKGIMFIDFIISLLSTILAYAQPFLLSWFIRFFSQSESDHLHPPPLIEGYFVALLMFLLATVKNLFLSSFISQIVSSSCSTSLKVLIYNKALRLSPEARKGKTTGDIVNNATTDVSNVVSWCSSAHALLFLPLNFTLCLLALYKFMGKATWAGVVAASAMIPLSGVISSSLFLVFPKLMKSRDKRVSFTTELLNSIKSIKLYSWESSTKERLHEIRNNQELRYLQKIGIIFGFIQFVWGCVPFVISCASFWYFSKFYNIPLVPEIVFPSLALFDGLMGPVAMVPVFGSQFVQVRESLIRLVDLLLLDEQEITPRVNGNISQIPIKFNHATFLWTKPKEFDLSEDSEIESTIKPALSDLDFEANKGELTCVVGKVGSGKSSILKAILGELPISLNTNKSDIQVNGSIAYCSQIPWILNGTVRENILFGCKFDESFYNKTVDACELLKDFEQLPDGDSTLVGEKGISLSGGQKARLTLARSVYSRADIYLLDDVLSAVDVHVGKKIIHKVLSPNGILKGKTKVLATNSVPVLSVANSIYLLQGGKIVESGSYSTLIKAGDQFSNFIKEFGKDLSSSEPVEEKSLDIEEAQDENNPLTLVKSNESIGPSSLISISEDTAGVHDDEVTAKGQVKLTIFIEYLKAFNYKWAIVYVLVMLLLSFSGVLENAVLTVWSQHNSNAGTNVDTRYYLSMYISFGVGAAVLNLVSNYVLWTFCILPSARYFHDTMINSLLRAPMRFFETTPVGRILNRFTNDISVVDMELPFVFMSFFSAMISGVVTFLVVIYNLPLMIFVIGSLLVAYNEIRKYYIPCSRQLNRLSKKTSSPQLAHLQESISGSDTIKAYGQYTRFVDKNVRNIFRSVTVNYCNQSCTRWLQIRLETISSVIHFSACLLLLLTVGSKRQIQAGLLGFIMSYVSRVTGVLSTFIHSVSSVETQTIAVERVIEYCNLTPEAPEVIEDNIPPLNWPSKGAISFVNYSTRYSEDLDPVLKDISFEINSNEKVGIVGRTGAGKSSITLALFRIIEGISGHIEIDGVDISKIGLADLRTKLSIIPQDATTVEGTVRENLDPGKKFTDEELWNVLELAHLKEHIASMKPQKKETEDTSDPVKTSDTSENSSPEPKKVGDTDDEDYGTGLEAKIAEGGSNISSGQKQLLCVARALLNPSKILILDEATAAVDVQTDKLIQETIRTAFKDRTILIIAHRLETIMDCDRILVLDHGKVKEFNTPSNLLEDESGDFYSLCKEGGQF